VLNGLGNVALDQGDYEAAQTYLGESMEIRQEIGDQSGVASSLSNLGYVACHQNNYESARTFFTESLAIQRELGEKRGIATTLAGFAIRAASQSQPERAIRLWSAADILRERIGASLPLNERARYERHVAATREALGETAFAAVWAEGQAMTQEQ